MKIENLKELQKVISLCRKLGVSACKIDGIEFSLGPLEAKQKPVFMSSIFDPGNIETSVVHNSQIGSPIPQVTPLDKVITNELTEEQLLFYSVSDQPEGVN